MQKKVNIIVVIPAIIALSAYFILRAQAINGVDHDSDTFFASFSSANHGQIKRHLHPANQDIENDLAIIDRHKEAIANFDYRDTKPSINWMLNRASVDVSWHLTIIFKKDNGVWHICKLDEYIED